MESLESLAHGTAGARLLRVASFSSSVAFISKLELYASAILFLDVKVEILCPLTSHRIINSVVG